jgi:dihydrofolate reductase
MGAVTAFVHVTIDGFFAGPRGEIDWFKAIRKDAEYDAFTHQQSQSGNTLVFGRTTHDMMKSYWPTPAAVKADPRMAEVVNRSPKLVFSRTLRSVEEGPNWKNIELVHDIVPADIRKRKEKAGTDFTILGSGSIVQQFANHGLLDEYALVVVPIVLGAGKPLFDGVRQTDLDLLQSRSFQNGLTVLTYRPQKDQP